MIALLQRVKSASVKVDGTITGEIGQGILVFLGVDKEDSETSADKLCNRILSYRIFSDENDKMNLNVQQINGQVLLVSQFTLVANTRKGNRPSFSSGAMPEQGKRLYEYALNKLQASNTKVAAGIFGADMQVELINDGPVTFVLEA